MADITVTAANVGVKGAAQVIIVQVGEAVTQGQPLYQLASDSLYYKTDANASLAASSAKGIALTAASTSGYVVMLMSGALNPGATLVVGETYVVSATAGGIAPLVDVTTGWYPVILGIASSASQLDVAIVRGTVARA